MFSAHIANTSFACTVRIPLSIIHKIYNFLIYNIYLSNLAIGSSSSNNNGCIVGMEYIEASQTAPWLTLGQCAHHSSDLLCHTHMPKHTRTIYNKYIFTISVSTRVAAFSFFYNGVRPTKKKERGGPR